MMRGLSHGSGGGGHPRSHGHEDGHGLHHNIAGSLGGVGAAGAGAEDPVQSKADFLSTFTEDPHLLNFARHFCDYSSGGSSGSSSGTGNGKGKRGSSSGPGISSGRRLMLGAESLGDAPALARFFGGALLECLAGEKAEALGPHLSLCHSVVTARHTADSAAAWDLRLVLDYGRDSALQLSLVAAARANASGSSATGNIGDRDGRVHRGGVGREGCGGDSGGNVVGEEVPDGRSRKASAGGRRRSAMAAELKAEAEVQPPLPFTLLHPDLLASLEVRFDAFLASLGFENCNGGESSSSGGSFSCSCKGSGDINGDRVRIGSSGSSGSSSSSRQQSQGGDDPPLGTATKIAVKTRAGAAAAAKEKKEAEAAALPPQPLPPPSPPQKQQLSQLWRYLYGSCTDSDSSGNSTSSGRGGIDRDDDDEGGRGRGGAATEPGPCACSQEQRRLFGAYLAYFGIPSPTALKVAVGGGGVGDGDGGGISPQGLGLSDAPALVRGLPGLTPSALLKITSQG